MSEEILPAVGLPKKHEPSLEEKMAREWNAKFVEYRQTHESEIAKRIADGIKVQDRMTNMYTNIGMLVYDKMYPLSDYALYDADTNLDELTQQHCDNALKHVQMGKDFQVILTAINNNTNLKAEWDRFCFALKLMENVKNSES